MKDKKEFLGDFRAWSQAGNKLYEGFVVETIMDKWADGLLMEYTKWLLEEERVGVNPAPEDCESYVEDFKQTLKQ